MRIQKFLSQSGVCSRRKAEEYIKQGLIEINGEKAIIGQKIDPTIDKIKLHDKVIQIQNNFVYIKLNKPRGIETTCAQYGNKNIIDIINIDTRVFPIGRLDKETTGLILLTNDGRLANYLMHPKYNHEKEYVVETYGPISDNQLQNLAKPMFILGSYTKKAKIKRISTGKVKIVITEGKNRQIRRMIQKVGLQVKKLKRIRIENIELGSLGIGEYKHLTQKEKNELFKRLKIS